MTTGLKDSLGLIIGGKIEEKLLTSFFVLYKNARIIEENNATFQRQADGFLNQITSYTDDASRIELKTVNGRYFLNELRGPLNIRNDLGKQGPGLLRHRDAASRKLSDLSPKDVYLVV